MKTMDNAGQKARMEMAVAMSTLGGVLSRLATGSRIYSPRDGVLAMVDDGNVYTMFRGGDETVGAALTVATLAAIVKHGDWTLEDPK